MAKLHPQFDEGELDLSKRKDVPDFLSKLKKKTEQDVLSRGEWSRRILENYQRRYARLGRVVDFPFPNCCNLIIPTIDEQIDKVKAAEVSLYFNVRPINSFIPGTLQGGDVDRVRKLEHYFDYRLRYQSPDFFRELILGIDDRLSAGIGIFKTLYEYQDEIIHQSVLAKDLPGRLTKFSIMKSGNAEAANNQFLASRREVSSLTKKEFDQLAENIIKPIVISEFGLSVDDSLDKKALEDLMRFLRSGAEKVEIKYRFIKKHYPRLVSVDPLRLIVPPWTTDVDSASRVTHEMWMSKEEILSKTKSSGWKETVAEECLENKSGKPISYPTNWDSHYVKEERMGLSNTGKPETLYQINESHVFYDWAGDGIGQRCILTWCPNIETPLRFIAAPFDHGQVPFTVIPYELNERRHHGSRGIPEKIKDLDEEITQTHRKKQDAMTIRNAPVFTYKRNTAFNPFKVRWIPGEMYQVSEQGDLAAIPMPSSDMSYDREEAVLRAQIEGYVGVPDTALSNPLSSLTEPRTAKEVSLISQVSQRSLGYRIALFQIGMKRVMNQLWSLEQQFGPEEVWVHYTGEKPWKMTRKEIQGKYVVVPRGTIINSDPELQAQKALVTIQVLLQMIPFLEKDIRYEVDLGQAILDYFQIADPITNQRIIRRRTPEEIKQIQDEIQEQNKSSQAIERNEPVPLDVLRSQLNQASSQAPFGGGQRISGI